MDILAEYKEGERDFSEVDLRGADLSDANLCGANLYGADLRGADLSDADLREANLSDADLYGANLYRANLREANLYRADLREANLYGANLRGADLSDADLYRANLREANLYGANLREADLPTTSHTAISEILRQNAVTMRQYMVAGLVAIRLEWCWEEFISALRGGGFAEELRWALNVLKEWKCFQSHVKLYEEKEEEVDHAN